MNPATAKSSVEIMPAPPAHAHESEMGHHFEWIEFARVALVGIAAVIAGPTRCRSFMGSISSRWPPR